MVINVFLLADFVSKLYIPALREELLHECSQVGMLLCGFITVALETGNIMICFYPA
jgi:hypothetical protein